MKKTIYKIALLTGLVAASSLSAVAEPDEGEKKRPGGHRPGGPDRQAILDKFDENNDGKLDEGERKLARAAMEAKMAERKAAMIAKYDTDGNGTLDEGERKAAQAAMILERFDEDESGDLNADEQAKADAAMKRRGQRGPRGGKRGEEGEEGKRKRPGKPGGRKKPADKPAGEE